MPKTKLFEKGLILLFKIIIAIYLRQETSKQSHPNANLLLDNIRYKYHAKLQLSITPLQQKHESESMPIPVN